MNGVRVELFEAHDADGDDLAAYHRVSLASRGVDLPGEPGESLEALVERLRNPFPGLGDAVHWFVRSAASEVVGFVYARFPEGDNKHIAVVDVVVHPDARRAGVGTGVLRAVLAEVRARRRTVVEGWNVVEGSAGERWARSLGFTSARAVAVQGLVLAGVDRSRWNTVPSTGYRIEKWVGSAPDDVVASFAEARNAIHDAPTGDTEFRVPEWTVETVRAAESGMREQGAEQRVVVALRESDRKVVGLTEIVVLAHRFDECYQGDTAVLREHRGHGLGMCLKANMAEWLMADLPALERIETVTNHDNAHMLRVNDSFGFTTLRIELVLARDVAALSAVLDEAAHG